MPKWCRRHYTAPAPLDPPISKKPRPPPLPDGRGFSCPRHLTTLSRGCKVLFMSSFDPIDPDYDPDYDHIEADTNEMRDPAPAPEDREKAMKNHPAGKGREKVYPQELSRKLRENAVSSPNNEYYRIHGEEAEIQTKGLEQ